jgi:hypothetical protein
LGRTVIRLYTRNYGDGWNASGTASLQFHAGYSLGVIIDDRKYDSDARLMGTVKITPSPEPSSPEPYTAGGPRQSGEGRPTYAAAYARARHTKSPTWLALGPFPQVGDFD